MRPVCIILLLLALLLQCASLNAQRALGRYNVDKSAISTSGISSGGSMASQFHVIYSSRIMGVGTVAGSPYWCAKGSVLTATQACMVSPNNVNVNDLFTQTSRYVTAGDIDATSNMYNSKVFIWHGTRDTVVVPGLGPKVEAYYRNYVNPANIKTEYNIPSGHGQPTMDYGNTCATQLSPYINRCSYDGAFEILNHIYGGDLQRPTGSVQLRGDFYEFDQKEYFYISPPLLSSMDTVGYVYVPSACVSGQTACKLHIAFHGCAMGRHKLNDEYARKAGYNEVGELNNIIILYPQALNYGSNPNGCWDWWGYTVAFYATNRANQPIACIRMVERIVGA